MMEVPQLHGFGPAANRLLEAYKMLLKVPNTNIIVSHKAKFLIAYKFKISVVVTIYDFSFGTVEKLWLSTSSL